MSSLVIYKMTGKSKKLTSFELLNVEYPIHAKLSRLIAKDGLTFNVFKRSVDLRESIEAWIQMNKVVGRLPQSDSSIKSYVMQYGSMLKDLVKSVRESSKYRFPFSLSPFSISIKINLNNLEADG